MDTINVIGGGPSLADVDFNSIDGHIIATNMSVFDFIDRAKYFITIDNSFIRNKLTKEQYSQLKTSSIIKIFVANFASNKLVVKNNNIYYKNIKYDLAIFDKIIYSHRFDGIGNGYDDFRCGMNSGYCALQLAVILGYTNINLYGIDLCADYHNNLHYHDLYDGSVGNKTLNMYYKYFKSAIRDLKLMNININIMSDISLLNNLL